MANDSNDSSKSKGTEASMWARRTDDSQASSARTDRGASSSKGSDRGRGRGRGRGRSRGGRPGRGDSTSKLSSTRSGPTTESTKLNVIKENRESEQAPSPKSIINTDAKTGGDNNLSRSKASPRRSNTSSSPAPSKPTNVPLLKIDVVSSASTDISSVVGSPSTPTNGRRKRIGRGSRNSSGPGTVNKARGGTSVESTCSTKPLIERMQETCKLDVPGQAPMQDINHDIESLVERTRATAMETNRPTTPGTTHIDWAGDDDDSLPDLEDWGISSKNLGETTSGVTPDAVKASIISESDVIVSDDTAKPNVEDLRTAGHSVIPSRSNNIESVQTEGGMADQDKPRNTGSHQLNSGASRRQVNGLSLHPVNVRAGTYIPPAARTGARLSSLFPPHGQTGRETRVGMGTRAQPTQNLPTHPSLPPKPVTSSGFSPSVSTGPKNALPPGSANVPRSISPFLNNSLSPRHSPSAESISGSKSSQDHESIPSLSTQTTLLNEEDAEQKLNGHPNFVKQNAMPDVVETTLAGQNAIVSINEMTVSAKDESNSVAVKVVPSVGLIAGSDVQRPHTGGVPPPHWKDNPVMLPYSSHQRNRSAPQVGSPFKELRTRSPHAYRPVLTVDALQTVTRSLGATVIKGRRESPAPSIASVGALEQ